jgi:hypothetical protein
MFGSDLIPLRLILSAIFQLPTDDTPAKLLAGRSAVLSPRLRSNGSPAFVPGSYAYSHSIASTRVRSRLAAVERVCSGEATAIVTRVNRIEGIALTALCFRHRTYSAAFTASDYGIQARCARPTRA